MMEKMSVSIVTGAGFLLILNLLIGCTNSSIQTSRKLNEALNPSEWAVRFRCDGNASAEATSGQCQRMNPKQADYCSREEDVCARHHADWMWKYADELQPEFQVLVKERSIDERLANIIYATVTTRELDIEYHEFNAKDPKLEEHFESLVVGPQVNYTRCQEHLSSMLSLFDEYQQRLISARSETSQQLTNHQLEEKFIRLARVLDSNGRYASGTLSGKFYFPGAYDQCINSQLSLARGEEDPQLVGMRFCVASVTLEPNLSEELKARQRFGHERSALVLQVGLCLPASCHSKSLLHQPKLLQRWLEIEFKFPSSIYVHETANMTSLNCVIDEQSPMALPTSGKVLICLVSSWLMLITYATYKTCIWNKSETMKLSPSAGFELVEKSRKSKQTSWLSCLSLINNLKDFLEIKETEATTKRHSINLDVLNPIKVIACIWVTVGHAFLALHFGSNNLLRDFKLMESDRSLGLLIVSPLWVETYFVISGMLVTYTSLKRDDKYEQSSANDDHVKCNNHSSSYSLRGAYRNSLDLLKKCLALIVSRWLRLLPLFYLAFWFKKSFFPHLGWGLLWNFGFNKEAGGQCTSESWWSPLSLNSVYDPILRKCLPQSYTITSDMIFIIISAPFIFTINKFQRTIVAMLIPLSLWSLWVGMAQFMIANTSIVWNLADYKSYGMLQMVTTPLSYIYTSPDYRLFSIFFGVLAGWLVYRYDEQGKSALRSLKHAQGSKWLWKSINFLAITHPVLITLLAIFRNEFKSLSYPYHRTLFPYYFMSTRALWALSSAIVILRLLTDWAHSPFVDWMKAKFWRILAKLNYSILLIHFDLLFLQWQIHTNELVTSKLNIITTMTFAHTASMFIGMIIHVLIENPINKLIKRYIA